MFWPRENWDESKKERGGRGRGEKETLAVKPLDFQNPVRQRKGLVIGSALVLIIDMCPSKIRFCENPTWQKKGKTCSKHVWTFSLRTGTQSRVATRKKVFRETALLERRSTRCAPHRIWEKSDFSSFSTYERRLCYSRNLNPHENISRVHFENNFYLEAAFGKVIYV